MKLILYSNEKVYQQIYDHYAILNETNQIIGSDFDRNSYDIIHINSPKYINYAIDTMKGYHNITHVIIQKTFFKNEVLIKILKLFKYINPEIKVIIFMNVPDEYIDCYDLFMSKVVKENIGFICKNPEELEMLMDSNFEIDQTSYILNKITRRQKKEFIQY